MQVRVTNPFGAPISSTVTFTYTEENDIEKGDIKPQDIRNMDVNDLPLALMEIARRMGEMSLKEETRQPGKLGKHHILVIMIVDKYETKILAAPHLFLYK